MRRFFPLPHPRAAGLWKSDGTEAGTVIVQDFTPGDLSPKQLTLVGEKLYMVGVRDDVGKELFVPDLSLQHAPTDLQLSKTSITESAPIGAAIGQLLGADSDVGDVLSYSFVSGDGDVNNAAFDIINGQLVTKAKLDYETKSSYDVRLRVTDQDGLSFDKASPSPSRMCCWPGTSTATTKVDILDFGLLRGTFNQKV